MKKTLQEELAEVDRDFDKLIEPEYKKKQRAAGQERKAYRAERAKKAAAARAKGIAERKALKAKRIRENAKRPDKGLGSIPII